MHAQGIKFEPQHYKHDPKTESIFSSRDLHDGMVIMLCGPGWRASIDPITGMYKRGQREKALKNNRWARIENVEIVVGFVNSHVAFDAVYSDGTKIHRKKNLTETWFVKNDSTTFENIKRAKVTEIIADALNQQDSATYHGVGSTQGPNIRDVVDSIFDVLKEEQ